MSRTSWALEPMVLFDKETTGVDWRTDRTISACVAELEPARPEARVAHQWLINPGVPVGDSVKVHGLTDEYLQTHGTNARDAIEEIGVALGFYALAGMPIVGMNLAFDLSFLHYEHLRHGLGRLAGRFSASIPDRLRDGTVGPIIDIYVLDKEVDQYRKGGRKLVDLCRTYGVRHDGAHDATEDAWATARVAYMIAKRYPRIGSMDPWDLHECQVGWRRQQCRSLEVHFNKADRRASRPLRRVDPCWPICYCEPDQPPQTESEQLTLGATPA